MADDKVYLRDVYDIVNRLEKKMDVNNADLSRRIDALETFRDRWAGGITVLSIFAGSVASFITRRILGE